MLQKRLYKGECVGFEEYAGDTLFFFGTRHCPRGLLPELYPNLRFAFLRQVHGRRILQVDGGDLTRAPEADGQTTDQHRLALVIQTADCLPILFSTQGRVAALHAGWRGLASGIVAAAAEYGRFDRAVIGPHIRNYEVGMDVVKQLAEHAGESGILPHPDLEKRYVNLSQIAERQLRLYHGAVKLDVLPDDTLTSPLFFSYRRGKEKSDRQYSFVARLKEI